MNSKFQIFNSEGKRIMHTDEVNCLPDKKSIEELAKNGYKFKIDGKTVSKKEFIRYAKRGESV